MPTRRRLADLTLLVVTVVELGVLFGLTDSFAVADWIYVAQHLIVLGVALVRPAPEALDRSLPSAVAAGVAYAYPYAIVVALNWAPGHAAWPKGGLVMVTVGAVLSITSLLTLGRFFGVRPALRGLVTKGPYALVRHPIYLSYLVADVGYGLQEWRPLTVLLIAIGWASLAYRIHAEERVLRAHPSWSEYARKVRWRIVPGAW